MRFDKINPATKILTLLKKHFKITSIESFPLSIKNLRLYKHIEVAKNFKSSCLSKFYQIEKITHNEGKSFSFKSFFKFLNLI